MSLFDDHITEDQTATPVRCPVCGALNKCLNYCRHVRWTFDQGDPLEFAHFALETSPYNGTRGYTVRDIPKDWWEANAGFIVDRVLVHFDASDGYVFGQIGDLDLLARDIWKAFLPDPIRPELIRH
jgi:hypothetical protein